MAAISKTALAAIAMLGSLNPAIAAMGPPAGQRPALDPNQKICEDIIAIGSRLATKRICATRAEWAEKRKQDKEAVDQMQRLQGRPCVDAWHGTGAAPAC